MDGFAYNWLFAEFSPMDLPTMKPLPLLFAIVFLSSASSLTAQEATQPSAESVKPGINERFLDTTLDVQEWIGRFEVESREVFSARERVLSACQIQPGMTVADIGAGTGFYSRLFANEVGDQGWVYAVDLSTNFLQHINKQSDADRVQNITCVLGTDRSVRLPAASVDFVFVCDTYHHFEFPQSTLASIYKALKPGGTMVVIDFERIPGQTRDWTLGHVRAGKEVFRKEIEAAGFSLVEEVEIPSFKENYLLRFRKE
ncbi:Ubiquinone/menaquinone biosynthesis C-methyltransferase UbiE [Stieleria bergensis]|uniref:Ubiquinone/menaquinone biosynthesis C-methyltransferase UbiE n=2 Tax=Stieleria bergensis TaxID=2528025 RepID=A0A517T2M1_9BACT|nr:Ubiquinone/menaquinone biosynthesis C-methyltransferase UbiE [Planctomycetes bacterium SV_7m_r]